MAISENVKEIYGEIKKITEMIGKIFPSLEIITAAKKQDRDTLLAISENAEKEHPELLEQISNLIQKYKRMNNPKIFSWEENLKEELYVFDSSEIDPFNLIILLMLNKGRISEWDLFDYYRELIVQLERCSLNQLANYARSNYFKSFVKDFMDAYKI